MGLSFWQIAIVVLLVVLLFGRGKLSSLMGDLAKGIKSFKSGMAEDEPVLSSKSAELEGEEVKPAQTSPPQDVQNKN